MAVSLSLVVGGSFAIASHKVSADGWYNGGNYNCGCDNPVPPIVYAPPPIYVPPPTYTPIPVAYAPIPVYAPAPIYTPPPVVQVVQTAPLQVVCQAMPAVAPVGSTITWRAYVSGGYGYYNNNYSVSWTGTDGLLANSSTLISKTYITPGQKVATVTVYKNGQTVTASCSSYVTAIAPAAPIYTTPPTSNRVYLNQVPYTGAGSVTRVSLFLAFLAFWSILVAWIVMKRRRAARLAALGAENAPTPRSVVAPLQTSSVRISSGNFLTDHVNQLRQAL